MSLPDGSTASLTGTENLLSTLFPGAISTATDTYTVERTRMSCGDRDVVRYAVRGTFLTGLTARSMYFFDLESGREYFLCWKPRGWFDTDLVLMEDGCDIGRYFTPTDLHEDVYESGDTLAVTPGTSSHVALLIVWLGMVADFFDSGS